MLLLILGPLTGLAVIPLIRERFHPPAFLIHWLSSPFRAAPVLVAANALTLGATAILALIPVPLANVVLPGFGGPVLTVAAWTALGLAMPLEGARRWATALVGMLPYSLLALAAWSWYRGANATASPEADMFMAWMGVLIMTGVSVGAVLVGTLVTALNVRRPS